MYSFHLVQRQRDFCSPFLVFCPFLCYVCCTVSSRLIPANLRSIHTSVDAGGQVIIITQYYTPAAASVSSAAAAASSSAPANDGPSIPIGAIIGISVAVGVIILALIGCAVWRMKRRNGDEDEAIRWPELNRHGDSDAHHALPARATGKHGIETDALVCRLCLEYSHADR